MTPEGYIEARADLLVDLSEVVGAKGSEYGARFVELLEHPDMRSDLIIEDACGYLGERRAEESGDLDDGEAWGAELAEWCELSWQEIHEIPPPTRGDTWMIARRLVAAVCRTQALTEIAGEDLIKIGAELGKVTGAAGAMGDTAKRKAATEGATKEAVARIAAARRAANAQLTGEGDSGPA